MENCHSFKTPKAIAAFAATRDLWDTPLFESKSFLALPTVGALVEGWLLVIPKEATISFAHLSPRLLSELKGFLEEVVPVLESHYGPVCIFEHGPAKTGSTLGCGVDYAHLHLVPTRFDIHAGAKLVAPEVHWETIDCLEDINALAANPNGYWFLQQVYNSSCCYVGTIESGEPMSQLFRRVIANYLGSPSKYDWKSGLGEELIAATVKTLSKSLICA